MCTALFDLNAYAAPPFAFAAPSRVPCRLPETRYQGAGVAPRCGRHKDMPGRTASCKCKRRAQGVFAFKMHVRTRHDDTQREHNQPVFVGHAHACADTFGSHHFSLVVPCCPARVSL